jgi:GT2 family glycosyltransferase
MCSGWSKQMEKSQDCICAERECQPQGDLGLVVQRPFWSVMVPTYNPREDYLRTTIRSVLAACPQTGHIQLEVVDDCSPQGSPEGLVREFGHGQVRLHRESVNRGLAATWNQCIERAQGQWVHILHQDDLVLPGFYDQLRQAIARFPEAGIAFTRFAFINEDGHWTGLGAIENREIGLLSDAALRLAASQRIQCAAVVVRRDVYERIGGFRNDLFYALDWEMWARIAAHYPVLYIPEILAAYRVHSLSETERIKKAGNRLDDVRRCIEINFSRLPVELAPHSHIARRMNALEGPELAWVALIERDYGRAYKFVCQSLTSSCHPLVVMRWLALVTKLTFFVATRPFRLARRAVRHRIVGARETVRS